MQRSYRRQPTLTVTFTAPAQAYLDDFEERLHNIVEYLRTHKHPHLIDIVGEVRSDSGEVAS